MVWGIPSSPETERNVGLTQIPEDHWDLSDPRPPPPLHVLLFPVIKFSQHLNIRIKYKNVQDSLIAPSYLVCLEMGQDKRRNSSIWYDAVLQGKATVWSLETISINKENVLFSLNSSSRLLPQSNHGPKIHDPGSEHSVLLTENCLTLQSNRLSRPAVR